MPNDADSEMCIRQAAKISHNVFGARKDIRYEDHVLHSGDIIEFIGQCLGGTVLIDHLDCRNFSVKLFLLRTTEGRVEERFRHG